MTPLRGFSLLLFVSELRDGEDPCDPARAAFTASVCLNGRRETEDGVRVLQNYTCVVTAPIRAVLQGLFS